MDWELGLIVGVGTRIQTLKLRKETKICQDKGRVWEGVWGRLESELIWALLFGANRREMPRSRFKDP